MEAYSVPKDASGEDGSSGNKNGRVRWVNSVSEVVTPAEDTRIQQLENEQAKQRKEVQQLRSDLSKKIGGQSRPSTPLQPAVQSGCPNPAAAPFQTSATDYQPSKYVDGTTSSSQQQQPHPKNGQKRRGLRLAVILELIATPVQNVYKKDTGNGHLTVP
jgi:hypothetical protein